MKSILMSIRPEWVRKIEYGKKTIEVRKTRPKLEPPFKCYIYCTFPQKPVYDICINRGTENSFLGNGKVIGEFVCDKIYGVAITGVFENGEQLPIDIFEHSCLTVSEFHNYVGIKNRYGWHISELKIYDKPKDLGAFISTVRCKKFDDYMVECDYNCKSYHAYSYQTACGMEDESECMSKGHKPITRAPRSWCYVEELEVCGD